MYMKYFKSVEGKIRRDRVRNEIFREEVKPSTYTFYFY